MREMWLWNGSERWTVKLDDKWIEEAILDGPVQDYMNGWKDFLGDVICLDYNEFGGRNRKMKGRQKNKINKNQRWTDRGEIRWINGRKSAKVWTEKGKNGWMDDQGKMQGFMMRCSEYDKFGGRNPKSKWMKVIQRRPTERLDPYRGE